MSTTRATTLSGRLARLGFGDADRAQRLLADPAIAALVDPLEDVFDDGVLSALGAAPDPDLALLALVRLLETLHAARAPQHQQEQQQEEADSARLFAALRSGGQVRDRLLAVLGGSVALGDHLARHPEHWTVLADDDVGGGARAIADARVTGDRARLELLAAVGADPQAAEPVARLGVAQATDALRVAYRRRLLAIAGRDLVSADPVALMPTVGRELADLASAALEAALAIARAELPQGCAPCRIAVIGMGKCGGRELNYVSDVDVIYVVEPVEPVPPGGESAALSTGARLAAGLSRACSAATPEGTLWPVDAGLRPEGRNGPLVRTLSSHVTYYDRWAATWEFQALLKARVVAGDQALGAAYLAAIQPMVWRAAERTNFVEDVQAMRRKVEAHVPAKEAARQLKLGPGGLRDVEFSVQLLQLVHGRADPRLRSGNTLEGLEALSTYGYVGRDDAAELDRAYRMLRTLEHRIQLYRLRRTHVVPDARELRWIGRSFGFRRTPATELEELWHQHALEVRRLHEKLFYRPLLSAAARLTTDEARLTPEAANARLAALGYRDPAGAMRHLTALTAGVSRRAAIQRQLLAVMLGWFADGADPDAGLLAFRRVSDQLGSTHWYLKMLRDSGAAAERMAHVLSASRLVAELLERGPEAVAMFGEDAELTPRPREETVSAVRRVVDRHAGDAAGAVEAARAVRRREIVRTGIADVVGLLDLTDVGSALSSAAIATLDGALRATMTQVAAQQPDGTLPTRLLVVGMGRLGGDELGYGSDADVMFVHEPVAGAPEKVAHDAAMAVVSELRRLLAVPGPEPMLEVDPDLRPEGRNGPLVRTLDSYARYYQRWSAPWESQALTRAVPIAGDDDLARRFVDLVDPLRWPLGGIDDVAVREIRRIKARIESERLPRGCDPHRHLKLGRGGLSDVEWTVQLLQLRHAHEVPTLRTPSTTRALAAAVGAGLLQPADGEVLLAAWRLASRVRNATVLLRGRAADTLPTKRRELDGVARVVGYPPGSAALLEDDYQRTTRRARAVVERVFYD